MCRAGSGIAAIGAVEPVLQAGIRHGRRLVPPGRLLPGPVDEAEGQLAYVDRCEIGEAGVCLAPGSHPCIHEGAAAAVMSFSM